MTPLYGEIFNVESSCHSMPIRGTMGSAAFDCYAAETLCIYHEKEARIALGFSLHLPEGWHALLLSRSSTMKKFGITMANSVGLVDSDYREQVFATVYRPFPGMTRIKAGDRICQVMIKTDTGGLYLAKDKAPLFVDRSGGFGSTGYL